MADRDINPVLCDAEALKTFMAKESSLLKKFRKKKKIILIIKHWDFLKGILEKTKKNKTKTKKEKINFINPCEKKKQKTNPKPLCYNYMP